MSRLQPRDPQEWKEYLNMQKEDDLKNGVNLMGTRPKDEKPPETPEYLEWSWKRHKMTGVIEGILLHDPPNVANFVGQIQKQNPTWTPTQALNVISGYYRQILAQWVTANHKENPIPEPILPDHLLANHPKDNLKDGTEKSNDKKASPPPGEHASPDQLRVVLQTARSDATLPADLQNAMIEEVTKYAKENLPLFAVATDCYNRDIVDTYSRKYRDEVDRIIFPPQPR